MTRSVVQEVGAKGVPGWTAFRLQVLLVDDEIEKLLPLCDALRRAGLAPTIATSIDELLFKIQMCPPDVVVLDAEMANRALFAQLHATALPVVLVNSAKRHDMMWRAMLATIGVTCIDKPIDAGMLVELLSDSSRFPMRSV